VDDSRSRTGIISPLRSLGTCLQPEGQRGDYRLPGSRTVVFQAPGHARTEVPVEADKVIPAVGIRLIHGIVDAQVDPISTDLYLVIMYPSLIV
jgi:hypothetical protein